MSLKRLLRLIEREQRAGIAWFIALILIVNLGSWSAVYAYCSSLRVC